ncbi:MAG: endo-1,4-beta-xylanase [Pseudomonadota bacterium]
MAGVSTLPWVLGGPTAHAQTDALSPRNEPSLKAVARRKGIEIGSAYDGGRPDLEDLIAHHCDVVTPENALKPNRLAPYGLTRAEPSGMDAIYQFCQTSSLGVHGHTLFWHHSLPDWLNRLTWGEATRAHQRLMAYAMSRYSASISWDVVNEPFADEAAGYRASTTLLDRFGDDFVHFLFQTARGFAPNAKLVLNDYNLACGDDFCERKRDTTLRTLDRLLARGTPIDAIGVQAHLVPRWPTDPQRFSSFVRDIGNRGVEVFITELDVNDVGLPANVAQRDRLVADIYRDFLDAILPLGPVTRLTFWGLSDAAHWIVQGYAPYQREVGRPRPALFDDAMQPKLAFFAVLDALERLDDRRPT